ncbi:hypothetical protein GCM10025793_23930 [Lysobacter lycopersici]
MAQPAHAQATDGLSTADRAAIFKAAGATKQKDGRWVICTDDPQTSGASIDEVRDLNGDGRPEAVVNEDGTFCNGMAGTRFALVSKQADGSWRSMLDSEGMAEFLPAKGKDGWPDVSVGGPGFCFPVMRWNGSGYAFNRNEYEGKRCTP